MTHTTRILNFLHHPDTQHGAALLCLFAAFPKSMLAIVLMALLAAFLIKPLAHATAYVQCFCQWVGSTKIFNCIFHDTPF